MSTSSSRVPALRGRIELLARLDFECRYIARCCREFIVGPLDKLSPRALAAALLEPGKLVEKVFEEPELSAEDQQPDAREVAAERLVSEWTSDYRTCTLDELEHAERAWFGSRTPGVGSALLRRALRLAKGSFPPDGSPVAKSGQRFVVACHALFVLQLLEDRADDWRSKRAQVAIRRAWTPWSRLWNRLRRRPQGTWGSAELDELPRSLAEPIDEARRIAAKSIDLLHDQRPDTGAIVSGFFALEALRALLSGGQPEAVEPDGDPWSDVLETLSEDVEELLAELVAVDPLLRGRSVALAALVEADEPPSVDGVAKQASAADSSAQDGDDAEPDITEEVRNQLRGIESFTRELLGREAAPGPREPLLVGATGRATAGSFGLLRTPELVDGGSLASALADELERYEQKLFDATVVPRPLFYLRFIDLARRKLVMFEDDHFPLTPRCMWAMVVCHNAFVLQAASVELDAAEKVQSEAEQAHREAVAEHRKAQRAIGQDPGDPSELPTAQDVEFAEREAVLCRDRVRKACAALDQAREELLEDAPSSGDMLAIHLALERLRGVLATIPPGSADLSGAAPAPSWQSLLPELTEPVRAALLALASLSPLAQILHPLLERQLSAAAPDGGGIPGSWQYLSDFLEDPTAGPLRELAVRSLTERAFARDLAQRGTVHRALGACLETKTVGGALLVAEFFVVLFDRVFGAPALYSHRRRAAAVRRAGETDYAAGQREQADLERATQTFKSWFFDAAKSGPRKTIELLVDLMIQVAECERQGDRDDGRLRLLGSIWSTISVTGTRGLRARTWSRRPRRMLLVFWLEYCYQALSRPEGERVGLRSSMDEWDDLREFGAALWHQLESLAEAQRRREERRKSAMPHVTGAEADEQGAQDEASTQEEREDREDFVVIERLCGTIASESPERGRLTPFQKALLARQLLVPGRRGLVINESILGGKAHV